MRKTDIALPHNWHYVVFLFPRFAVKSAEPSSFPAAAGRFPRCSMCRSVLHSGCCVPKRPPALPYLWLSDNIPLQTDVADCAEKFFHRIHWLFLLKLSFHSRYCSGLLLSRSLWQRCNLLWFSGTLQSTKVFSGYRTSEKSSCIFLCCVLQSALFSPALQ